MTGTEAVALLVRRFPVLKERVDHVEELFETPHVSYGLLATEVLQNTDDSVLLNKVATFMDELASSGDDLLEEFLVIDLLEGIAQAPEMAERFGSMIGPKAGSFLQKVEREYYGRTRA